MSMPARIVFDGRTALVNTNGELSVGRAANDISSAVKLEVAATVYNLVEPKAGNNVIITGFVLTGNKLIAVGTDAEVSLFEAASGGGASIGNITTVAIGQSQNLPVSGLQLVVPEGRYVNASTTDDDVFVTLFYYYAPTR